MTATYRPPQPPPIPSSTQALSSTSSLPSMPGSRPATAAASNNSASTSTEIKLGMTTADVRRAFGAPKTEVVFGDKLRWTYSDLTVVFEKGRVVDVKF